MASVRKAPLASLFMAAGLTALLAACSGSGPSAVVREPSAPPVAAAIPNENRPIPSVNHADFVPRAYLEQSDLEDNAPISYTVVQGDTLWDLSARFLKEPWLWGDIWAYNPQVSNPHLIYPGDVLSLEYVDGSPTLLFSHKRQPAPSGQPELQAATLATLDVEGNPLPQNGDRLRLSPKIRSELLEDAIPTIPGDAIKQFLTHPKVVDASVLQTAPYIVANVDNRLISAVGHHVYARGPLRRDQSQYGIFRRSKELRDPFNQSLLGYEITHVADAKLLNIDDPSTLIITSNNMETSAGDILLPAYEQQAAYRYVPRRLQPKSDVRIISLVNAISQTGRNQIVVLNIGTESNAKAGDVLAVETRGKEIIDRHGRGGLERLSIPDTRTGVVMVFKAFDKVSYALVMESTRAIMLNDIVTGI